MKSRRHNIRSGFTLIELLAVIAILAVIMLFAAQSVTSALNKAQRRAFIIDAEKIVDAAKAAYTEALNNKETGAETVFCMSIDYLRAHGLEKYGEVSGSVLLDVSSVTASYTIWLANGAFQINGIKMTELNEDVVEQYSTDASNVCSGFGNALEIKMPDSDNPPTPSDSEKPSNPSKPSESKDPDVEKKDSDNTLKSIIIDGKSVPVKDKINYVTIQDKIDVQVETNAQTATYEIRNNANLVLGSNTVFITVKAENGATKRYLIQVSREKELSSDTGIRVFVNDNEIPFDNYKGSLTVSSTTERVKVKYYLNNTGARAEVSELGELQEGDNELKIKVTAMNGKEQDYIVVIHKEEKAMNLSVIILYSLLAILGLYLLFKIVRRV